MQAISELLGTVKKWFSRQPKMAQIVIVGFVAFAIIAYAMSFAK